MKLIVDIPDEEYELYKFLAEGGMGSAAINRILKGKPYEERKTGRWISVTEKLPDTEECYLVTTTGTYNDVIDIARYVKGIWHKASRIKAWMPLPEPYCGAEMKGAEE